MTRWIWKILFTSALAIALTPTMQRWQAISGSREKSAAPDPCHSSVDQKCPGGNCGNLHGLQKQLELANLKQFPDVVSDHQLRDAIQE